VVKQKLKTHVPEAFKLYQPSSLGGESDREAFRKQDSNLPSPMEYLRITFENEDASTDLKATTKNSGEDLIEWIKVVGWH